ncbi:hypothetical protein BIY23_01485 [Wolbachia pipientis]|uniref:Uncharacterized protein n=1 Tax=Wolbachia pipientis TaxID=955 RepID=A0A1E7QKY3_WOLPI|nr:hypothetical protein [Wolbachia pipientis]OEY87135.1 hypothetical protein BIY23_01485 [Wolbachia pipientis]
MSKNNSEKNQEISLGVGLAAGFEGQIQGHHFRIEQEDVSFVSQVDDLFLINGLSLMTNDKKYEVWPHTAKEAIQYRQLNSHSYTVQL